MVLLRYHFRCLFRSTFYLLLLALAGLLVVSPSGGTVPDPATKGTLTIVFLFATVLLSFTTDPRKTLGVHPFWLQLPAVRERLALTLWLGMALPLLAAFWPFYGFSLLWGFHAISLLEFSLLVLGSPLGWFFLPLPLAAWMGTCLPDRWLLFLLLAGPYLLAVAAFLARKMPSRHWNGFRYAPRYAIPIAIALIGFDLYQRSTHTAMRFYFGDFAGLQYPDFDRLLLVLGFLASGIGYLTLPFLNVFALRQVDFPLQPIRSLTGTPWVRRVSALGAAILLNLPVALLLRLVDFVTITPGGILHIVLSAACFNVLIPTTYEHSDWSGYALAGYLLWVHASFSGIWWLLDMLLALTALLGYDMDLWLPDMISRTSRKIQALVWDEA